MERATKVEAITTLVVDDEREAREGLLDLLRPDAEISVVGEAGTGKEAVAAIEAIRPELVFLDVQMPQLDGFGVLDALPAEQVPVVVFVTAYDQYAIRAFQAHAQGYLLKPFADERFAQALAHAKVQVQQRRLERLGREFTAAVLGKTAVASEPSAGGHSDRLPVRTGQTVSFIRTVEIDWIEARNYCAKLHVGGREYVMRETMTRLAARLDPTRFVRIHRSTIINLDRLQSLEPYFHGSYMVRLQNGTRLLLSRSRRPAFERAVGYTLR
jgi:two-component system, LytTR family, response regulator